VTSTACETPSKPGCTRAFSPPCALTREGGLARGSGPLLRRYGIEFPRPFLIKERAFRLVTAAPMRVAARDSEELTRPHTLFARIIFIEISAFDNDYPQIARMRVHSRVVPRRELRECGVRPLVRVAPKYGHGDPRRRRFLELGLICSHVDHALLLRARRFLGLLSTHRRCGND
jgi:hypothetical protein